MKEQGAKGFNFDLDNSMKIVADENIPLVSRAFGSFGEVETMPGRKIRPEAVRDAEVLLLRSITKVDAALLSGSRVRFVGTATIGVDHVDRDWLKSQGIGFASAPGSNAESVAEYIVAALLVLAERMNTTLAGKSLGIVGVGNVGSRVARNAKALGMQVLLNDPPLKQATGDTRYLTLEETLQADIVTLHVPLTREGPDRTWHLADEDFFRCMRPGSVFINTSRGAVVDSGALMKALGKTLSAAVLDVWEHEPGVDPHLLKRVQIGTPHIAGYSYDGKVTGTEMLYRAYCEFRGEAPAWTPGGDLPEPETPLVRLDTRKKKGDDLLREAVKAVYDIEADDRRMRDLLNLSQEEIGPAFDRLRKEYPRRREFTNTTVILEPGDTGVMNMLAGLRFRVEG